MARSASEQANSASAFRDGTILELRQLGSSTETIASLTLPALFDACERLLTGSGRDAVQSAARTDPQLLLDASSLLAEAAQRVDVAGLYSSNEEADDVATQTLKYMLLPAIHAEFLMSSPTADNSLQARLRLVGGAITMYSSFLARAAGHYGLAGDAGRRIMQQEMDAEESSDQAVAGPSSSRRGNADPNAQRMAKIEKFKREKAIQRQLDEIEEKRHRHQRSEQDDVESTTLGGPGMLDEDDERRLWLLKLEAACLHALSNRQLLRDELQILQHACSSRQDGGSSGSRGGGGTSTSGGDEASDLRLRPRGDGGEAAARMQAENAALLQQLRGIASALDGGKREHIRDQVFRPSHTMPTMTIEELADIETADMMQREVASQAAGREQRAREEAAGSDEDEAAVMEQRAKDDWKDANPFGWGNSKLKPCG